MWSLIIRVYGPFRLSICNCGKDYSLESLCWIATPCCCARRLEAKEQSSEGVQLQCNASLSHSQTQPNPTISLSHGLVGLMNGWQGYQWSEKEILPGKHLEAFLWHASGTWVDRLAIIHLKKHLLLKGKRWEKSWCVLFRASPSSFCINGWLSHLCNNCTPLLLRAFLNLFFAV